MNTRQQRLAAALRAAGRIFPDGPAMDRAQSQLIIDEEFAKWQPADYVTMATPGVEPVNRDGVEPTPGDLGIFRSIADLATRGLVHFVEAGECIAKGLSFKRWDGGDHPERGNVAANLMGDGFRMRMLVRPGEEPIFELLIDNPDEATGMVTIGGVIDALRMRSIGETRIAFLEGLLAKERAAAQGDVLKAKP